MRNIRAAVVGVGSMGRNHARVLSQMSDIELVGVVDSDVESASAVALAVGCEAYSELSGLPDVDFAVVAVPTGAHLPVAEILIGRGVALLVEKPLAPSPEEADRLVELAERAGVLLATGHIERFNPVVASMAKMVTGPRLMQFSRLSPYTPRIRESIVFDLMVHDLDLACMFAGSAPERVVAGGIRVWSDTLDAASAILTFPNGCVSSVTASRITQDKVRRITVSEDERYFEGDCLRQELCIKRETHGEFTADAGYRQASVVEIPSLDRRAEPLMLELRSFVEAMRGEAEIRVSGRAGAAAVRLAHQVETMASSA